MKNKREELVVWSPEEEHKILVEMFGSLGIGRQLPNQGGESVDM